MRAVISFSIALLVLLTVPSASAQLSTASINGIVRDASGSVIPDAELMLTNIDTNVERRTRSNSAGVYVFLNVLPGNYRLQASKQGFATNRVDQFTLVVNQTATFDFTLAVGSVTESVTVEATGAEIQASTAELGAAVTRRQVMDLPLNGRNFTQLLSLTPGVAPVSVSQNSGGFGATVTSGTQFTFPSINGQTNRSNFFMLDGVNNQGAFTSTYAVPPIIDTIQEFKVQSHNDQAEFGQATGGIINVVSKSGTNDLHGSAWEYVRNDAFDARGAFLPSVAVFRQNQFGAAGGGPVVLPKMYNGKNRTFFYLGYQGWRYRRPANAFRRVPTQAELNGDFRAETRQLFDPFSTRPNPAQAGAFLRDPFPQNQLPQARIDRGVLAYVRALVPAPNFSGLADRNYLEGTPFRESQEEYTARADHQLTDKDFVWFRYSGLLRDADGSGGLPSILSIAENRAKNVAVSWNRTFSPTLVVQAQYGRVHVRGDSFTRHANRNLGLIREVGFVDTFAGNFQAADRELIPALNVFDWFSGGEGNSLNPNFTDVNQFKGNASKIIGNHTLRWGGELNSSNFEAFYNNANSTFQPVQTNNPASPGNTGAQFASFLLNLPDSAGRRNVHETVRWGGTIGFYFQDSWKATDRLTINLGFRYDRTFIPPYGADGSEGENGGIETGAYDLQRGVYILQKQVPLCRDRGRAPCIPGNGLPANVEVSSTGKIYRDTTTNWGPRVGLAYRLRQTTAIRAGFGIYYDNWAGVTQTSQNYEGGWPDVAQQLANNMNVPSPANPAPTHRGTNPFPEGLFPTPTPFNQVLWYMDPNHRNPYSMQWNFGIQQQLNSSTVVTMNYVGSGGRRLQLGGYYNTALTPGPGDYRARTPFPYILPTFYDRSWSRSNYNSFQFLLDKKFSNGLAYMVNYTYAKSIDIGSSGWYGVEGHSVQDPYNFNRDRSVSGFDLTHVMSINSVYELPIGKDKRFSTGNTAADYILGNWQLNAITLFRSGLPYNLNINGDIANTGNASGYMRLNLAGNPKESNPTRNRWFNTDAFATPAPFTFGNIGRYLLRSDGIVNFDLSVFRAFPLPWGQNRRLEFRAEAFNAFNQVDYGVPVANRSSGNFGRVLGEASRPRQLQLGLKLLF
jgi:hypothetical protein